MELARESSGKGSRYGQFVLGWLYLYGEGGISKDYAKGLALHRLAAAQNLNEAQYNLGNMYYYGLGVAQDRTEAFLWYSRAQAAGHPHAAAALRRLRA